MDEFVRLFASWRGGESYGQMSESADAGTRKLYSDRSHALQTQADHILNPDTDKKRRSLDDAIYDSLQKKMITPDEAATLKQVNTATPNRDHPQLTQLRQRIGDIHDAFHHDNYWKTIESKN